LLLDKLVKLNVALQKLYEVTLHRASQTLIIETYEFLINGIFYKKKYRGNNIFKIINNWK